MFVNMCFIKHTSYIVGAIANSYTFLEICAYLVVMLYIFVNVAHEISVRSQILTESGLE